MISEATASDIKEIVNLLSLQIPDLEYDLALDSVRRQAVLANSTVLVQRDDEDAVVGVLFAQLTTNGMTSDIQAQITNIWTLDSDSDRAQQLVDYFCRRTPEVAEVLISLPADSTFELRGLVEKIITYRIT